MTAPPICDGCGAPASFAGPTGEPELYYRLNNLLQRVSVNGGLPLLAAMSLLDQENAFLIPGALVGRADHPEAETDILGWRGRTLFAGESKTTAAAFTQETVKRDLELSRALGVDEHLVICGEELPSERREMIEEESSSAGVPVRILDSSHLLLPAE